LKINSSAKSIQRLRKKLGLKGVRQQAATFDSIAPFYEEIRERFPTMGARTMVSVLRQDYGIKVGEYVLLLFSVHGCSRSHVAETNSQSFLRKSNPMPSDNDVHSSSSESGSTLLG
jgi:hypothetical protein